jgi:hypothetical protein
MRVDESTRHGGGRVLVSVYAFFALAAGARSGVQIGLQWHEAPLAYTLSAFSAAVYVTATLGLAFGWRVVAWAACSVELAGVLAIGTASVLDGAAFPDATVWSNYGMGYVFIPLVLPCLGLWWLRKTGRAHAARQAEAAHS